MNETPITKYNVILNSVGSLWFAAVLLVLVSLAMACATVFESMRGSEQALVTFYKAWWFELLLALLAVNVAVAVVVRYPFSRVQIGFVLTHSGILVVLLGAVVTKYFGVDGQVGIEEGKAVESFTTPEPRLSLVNQATRAESTAALEAGIFMGFRAVEHPQAAILSLDGVAAEIRQYIPDSEVRDEVINDARGGVPAIELSLSPTGRDDPVWVFVERGAAVGPLTAAFRVAKDAVEVKRWLEETGTPQDEQPGVVRVEHQGKVLDLPLERCLSGAVPVGDTGLTIRVLRYLPHAIVGPDKQLVGASDEPVNPAIEFELTGPEGTQKRVAFAKFPDFTSMHGAKDDKGAKVTFVAPSSAASGVPIEVLAGPEGGLHARFRPEKGQVVTREISIGVPIETPWPGMQFTVLRRLDNGVMVHRVVPVEPARETRVPAVLVRITSPTDTSSVWVQRHRPRVVTIDGTGYEVTFADKEIPLGFRVTLDRFRVGYYPGERRPRSYESQISIADGASGRTQSRVVSMNNPATYGGYTFYQSSYRMDESRSVSFLSVARDPGLPIVFAGYAVVMVGMVTVLITRMLGQRK